MRTFDANIYGDAAPITNCDKLAKLRGMAMRDADTWFGRLRGSAFRNISGTFDEHYRQAQLIVSSMTLPQEPSSEPNEAEQSFSASVDLFADHCGLSFEEAREALMADYRKLNELRDEAWDTWQQNCLSGHPATSAKQIGHFLMDYCGWSQEDYDAFTAEMRAIHDKQCATQH